MESLSFNLYRAGVLAPGLASLYDLQAVSCGSRRIDSSAHLTLPTLARLPPNERRRASRAARLALACIEQVSDSDSFLTSVIRSVFATDDGIGEISQQMLEILSTTRQVSPSVFPNSLHSSAAGYFSIAFQNQQSATTVSLGAESFAAGLLCAVVEACVSKELILFVSYDPVMTAPMDEVLPIRVATATAWIIGSAEVGHQQPVLGSFKLTIKPASAEILPGLPSWIPAQWAANSSAQGLAALGLLGSKSGSSYCVGLNEQVLVLEIIDGIGHKA